MVSIRRRRLLGLCSGIISQGSQNSAENANVASVHRMLLVDLNLPPTDVGDSFENSDAPNVINCNQQEDQNKQLDVCDGPISLKQSRQEVVKRRKQYRRQVTDNHVPVRGVYLKNSKWQAAIKVDKKQIHLGTLDSQDEAVHLYDRAAYVCGREPNFELSSEEKQELQKLNWDGFLAMTRRSRTAMSTKRTRRKCISRPTVDSVQNSDEDGEQQTDATVSA